ncbi:MAG: DUF4258 domain-containing protein [Terriglobia bacterium]|jgi:hypothetical protein
MATKLVFRVHALQRMFERQLGIEDVEAVVESGETIEDYPNDRPYPSRLVLGWRGARPVHVVVAHNLSENELIVITVYEPDPELWEADFRRRKT